MFAHLNPHSSDFWYPCALYSPCLHQLTMQSSLFELGRPVSVVVCVARKLRPCPSYSRRRDRINLGLWRSLYKVGGGTYLVLLSISNFRQQYCVAKIWGPSERAADYRSITYERSDTVVMHDCAPVVRMFFLCVWTPPPPSSAPTTANWAERRQTAKKVQANCVPQGLDPPAKPAAKTCSQSCQTSCQTLQVCSQTCCPGGR